MLGVIIGSACIVLVVTVALTAKRYIVGQIEAVGSNLIFGEAISPGSDRPETVSDQINPGDLEAVRREVPQVVEAAGTARHSNDRGCQRPRAAGKPGGRHRRI